MTGRFAWVAVAGWGLAAAATWCTAARADAVLEAFLKRYGQHPAAFALEKTVAGALARRDRAWFARAARGQDATVQRVNALLNDKASDARNRIGPCQLAALFLQGGVNDAARRLSADKALQVGDAFPTDTAAMAAENLARCEIINRLPEGRRLIGTSMHDKT